MRNAKPGAGIFAERNNPDPVVADYRHTLFRTWQERIRDPSLTVLLIFELSAFFFAAPLAAQGLPVARLVGSRNSSIECASISRLRRSISRNRCRRLSCNSDGREVKNSRRSSPGPKSWLNSLVVT